MLERVLFFRRGLQLGDAGVEILFGRREPRRKRRLLRREAR
jgi:hypothetical protein